MKEIFKPGHTKVYVKKVKEADLAIFHGELLHPVYSTFALARDFEWSSRLFFFEMKEIDDEGVGPFLSVDPSPAFVGEEINIVATVEKIDKNELICSIEATCANRIVAVGKTGRKMLKKVKLMRFFAN
jgi:fluoroacetyl-CoA thioesterase